MNITAVTMGMDEQNYKYAQGAAARVERFTGLKPNIVNEFYSDREFDNIFTKIIYNKLFMFDMFPDAEMIMYFDNDWCLNKPIDFSLIKEDKFNAVLDRYWAEFLQVHCRNMGVDVNKYFNAGFWVVHRNFKWIFDKAKNIYPYSAFLDQDSLNKVINEHGTQLMNILPDDWNVLDYHHSIGNYNDYTAIHNKSAFEIHKLDGTTI